MGMWLMTTARFLSIYLVGLLFAQNRLVVGQCFSGFRTHNASSIYIFSIIFQCFASSLGYTYALNNNLVIVWNILSSASGLTLIIIMVMDQPSPALVIPQRMLICSPIFSVLPIVHSTRVHRIESCSYHHDALKP
jgi:hypothetical protein